LLLSFFPLSSLAFPGSSFLNVFPVADTAGSQAYGVFSPFPKSKTSDFGSFMSYPPPQPTNFRALEVDSLDSLFLLGRIFALGTLPYFLTLLFATLYCCFLLHDPLDRSNFFPS